MKIGVSMNRMGQYTPLAYGGQTRVELERCAGVGPHLDRVPHEIAAKRAIPAGLRALVSGQGEVVHADLDAPRGEEPVARVEEEPQLDLRGLICSIVVTRGSTSTATSAPGSKTKCSVSFAWSASISRGLRCVGVPPPVILRDAAAVGEAGSQHVDLAMEVPEVLRDDVPVPRDDDVAPAEGAAVLAKRQVRVERQRPLGAVGYDV